MVALATALIAGIAAVVISLPPMSSFAAEPPDPQAEWTTVFHDKFDGPAGTAVNTAGWLHDVGTSYPGGAPNWGTGEIETMTDSTDNVYLDGSGNLAIRPLRDAAGNWTSGRIETQNEFAAPEGGKLRVEASLRLPDVAGAEAAGYWPAFWMLGSAARPVGATNWPGIGEWDIMEHANGIDGVIGTFHCGTAPGGPCNENTGISSGVYPCDCRNGFHSYAIEYDRSVEPEVLRWYHDNVEYHTVTATEVDSQTWANATQHGFYIILNVAIGGAFPENFGGGPTEATTSGQPMLVEYVTVYTSAGG